MYKTVFLFALIVALPAFAADATRCGRDAFGNAVCLDKDGVLIPAPRKAPVDTPGGGDVNGRSAPVGAASESGNRAGRDDDGNRVRCGIDQFGNTVCR